MNLIYQAALFILCVLYLSSIGGASSKESDNGPRVYSSRSDRSIGKMWCYGKNVTVGRNIRSYHCTFGCGVLPNDLECCNGKTYNTSTSTCCNDHVVNYAHYPRPDDLMCCEGEIVSKTHYLCCNGKQVPYENEADECCEGSTSKYNMDTEMCCAGKPYRWEDGIDCCGGLTFNDKTHECDNGIIRKKLRQGFEYCNGERYDSYKHKCCEGKLHENPIPGSECCGREIMSDPRNQLCCQDVIHDTFNGDQCCGREILQANSSDVCCDEKIHRYGGPHNMKCCFVAGIPGAMFDPANEMCCGGKVANQNDHLCCNNTPAYQDSANDTVCCGTQTYNPSIYHCPEWELLPLTRDRPCGDGDLKDDEMCCANVPHPKYSETGDELSCCGVSHYSNKTHMCMLWRVFKLPEHPEEPKCGQVIINKDREICCNGVKHSKVIDGGIKATCCGLEAINTQTHGCEIGRPFRLKDVQGDPSTDHTEDCPVKVDDISSEKSLEEMICNTSGIVELKRNRTRRVCYMINNGKPRCERKEVELQVSDKCESFWNAVRSQHIVIGISSQAGSDKLHLTAQNIWATVTRKVRRRCKMRIIYKRIKKNKCRALTPSRRLGPGPF